MPAVAHRDLIQENSTFLDTGDWMPVGVTALRCADASVTLSHFWEINTRSRLVPYFEEVNGDIALKVYTT